MSFLVADHLSWLTTPTLLTCVVVILLIWQRRDRKLSRLCGVAIIPRPRASAIGLAHEGQPEKSSLPEYVDVFPPSQREALSEMIQSLLQAGKRRSSELTFDDWTFRHSLVGFNDDYATSLASKYSFSGFSIGEIRALGDFPDYAMLSGVPLPLLYKAFSIETALPRPYRPFRWPYHQTMCKPTETLFRGDRYSVFYSADQDGIRLLD